MKGFQPLGYKFEIKSPMARESAIAAIRKKKKRWFAVENGARGWIVGPVMCLWHSPINQHGPMILAWIKTNGLGTTITGRAGADLNGMLAFLVMTPIMALSVLWATQEGQGSPGLYIVSFLVFVVGLPLILWISSQDRRSADPLVNFIRKTIVPPGTATASASLGNLASSRAALTVNGVEQNGPVSADDLDDALANLGTGEFVVLSFEPEKYMQVMAHNDEFQVEKREGSAKQHYVAKVPKDHSYPNGQFDSGLQRVIEQMIDYLHQREPTHDLNWNRLTP